MIRKAFTLIEVIVATGVLVVGILGVVSTYFGMAVLTETTRNVDLVSNAAAARIEYIRSDTFEGIDEYHHNIYPIDSHENSGGDNGDADDDIKLDLDYRLIVYVEDVGKEIGAKLKRVTVVGCWRQGERTIGADWVFDDPDPSAHPPPESRVTITTLMTER